MPPDPALDSWLAPSALLSSRWSEDNILTPDPAHLYSDKISSRVGLEELQALLDEFAATRAGLAVTAGSLGVLTWNIAYRQGNESFLLQLPLARDDPGVAGRSRAGVPERSRDNAELYRSRGLDRYLLAPQGLVTLGTDLRAAVFASPPRHRPLSFGQGRVRLDVSDDEGDWVVPLGEASSVDVLLEVIAAVAYHYDADEHGGTTISDLFVNDGDFLVGRRKDGAFSVFLAAARWRQTDVPPERLLLHLLQLTAYEDWTIGEDLLGLPVLMSHPCLVLPGFERGRRLRYRDLGLAEQDAQEEAHAWLRAFSRSPEGRGYRPWIERHLAGELPRTFGNEPRIPWWNLTELRQRRNVAQLRARLSPSDETRRAAETLSDAVARLVRQLELEPPKDTSTRIFVNDLGRREVMDLLEAGQASPRARADLADAWFERWPYRRPEDLPPDAGALLSRATQQNLDFRGVIPSQLDGSLESLAGPAGRPLRQAAWANPELFGNVRFPRSLAGVAAGSFPSFERYMDDVLHDPHFGYYSKRVEIGTSGDFSTNPENLSPHYGAWLAHWLVLLHHEMVTAGQLAPDAVFTIVEFGAGTGRLARDVIDAVRRQAEAEPQGSAWRHFARTFRYRIYELSPSLRARQEDLLGEDVTIARGDARSPGDSLRRDFPNGLVGVVLSNELPDAFGVHKVALSVDADAQAVLVVPRLEAGALVSFADPLAARVRTADAHLRDTFGWTRHPSDLFLDQEVFAELMCAIYGAEPGQRDAWLDALWFEEGLVPAATIPELSASLRRDASELAASLAEADSGVILYRNVHAEAFVREVAESLHTGYIITIDYGDSTSGLVRAARQRLFPFRIYRHEGRFVPKPNDPYARPGSQDLTADVDFTSLARAGAERGLHLVHFGAERDLAGPALPDLLAAAIPSRIGKFLGNPAFKLLVLGTGPSAMLRDQFEALSLSSDLTGRSSAELRRMRRIEARLRAD